MTPDVLIVAEVQVKLESESKEKYKSFKFGFWTDQSKTRQKNCVDSARRYIEKLPSCDEENIVKVDISSLESTGITKIV